MRHVVAVAAVCAALSQISPVSAQTELNRLDCRFNEATGQIDCPDVLSGRSASSSMPVEAPAAAQPAAPAPASDGAPAQGSAEWNAACAAKYKSFDPATGMYRSFSGQMRPCV